MSKKAAVPLIGFGGGALTGESAASTRETIGRLVNYARPYSSKLVLITILVIVGTLATLAGPILFGKAIDGPAGLVHRFAHRCRRLGAPLGAARLDGDQRARGRDRDRYRRVLDVAAGTDPGSLGDENSIADGTIGSTIAGGGRNGRHAAPVLPAQPVE